MADRGGASLDRAHLMRDRRADLVLLVASVIVVLPILWTATAPKPAGRRRRSVRLTVAASICV